MVKFVKRKRRRKTCLYCKRPLTAAGRNCSTAYTRDHIKPRSLGGRKTAPCCRACNEIKGNMDVPEWRAFQLQNPKWWRLWRSINDPRRTI